MSNLELGSAAAYNVLPEEECSIMYKRQLSPLQVTGDLCETSTSILSLSRLQKEENLNEMAQQVASLSESAHAALQADLEDVARAHHAQIEAILKTHLGLT